MLVTKKFILCVATTFFSISVHAGHKRIIIRVPQRTRHIYHHQVKKVPVYVILPSKKPKILNDLEELTDQQKTAPCKESAAYHRHDEPSSPTKPTKYGGRDSYQQDDWAEDHENTGSYRTNDRYRTEDYENTGSYRPNDKYRTINHEHPLPPSSELDFLPFRRTNAEYDDKRNYNDNRSNNGYHNYNHVADDQPYGSYRRNVAKKSTPDPYRKAHSNDINFTYAPSGDSGDLNDNVSYQYMISHRMDNRTLSER